jgi:tetratricopeptide (TPR) repeat protein
VDPNAILPQVYWHRLHAAREAHDLKTEQEFLDKLLALPPDDSDASIEVYRTLIEQGKADQAKAYFEKAYNASWAKLSLMRSDAEELNNIAWLCASCGQRIPDALKYSAEAVARQPEVFAFIDTAAAANAAAKNFTEAARLEKRALSMRPADDFMRQLYDKYEKEAAAHK